MSEGSPVLLEGQQHTEPQNPPADGDPAAAANTKTNWGSELPKPAKNSHLTKSSTL